MVPKDGANKEQRKSSNAPSESRRRQRLEKTGRCRCGRSPAPEIGTVCDICKEDRRRSYSNNRERIRADKKEFRKEILSHYGGICACCGEAEMDFLAVDHINNDGHNHRDSKGRRITAYHLCRYLEQNGYPSGYQILCVNCNWSKRLNGECIHKIKTKQLLGI